MLTELKEEEARRILSANNLARLACVLESGEPYVVPLNYFCRDEAIYFHSLEGLKLAALRANPKACVQVDEIKNNFVWRSIVASGEFEEITDCAEREKLLKILFKIFEKLTPAEAVRRETAARGAAIVFRINIRNLTGRAES